MKYILFTTLLLILTSCSKKPDTPECKALETIYTTYNKIYTCADKNKLSFRYEVNLETLDTKELEKVIEATKKVTECFSDFKRAYNALPIEIAEQMTYFHYLYNLYEQNALPIPPPKDGQTIEEVLKRHPIRLCMHQKVNAIINLENSQNPALPIDNHTINLYGKQCMKELGDKEYQESKKKFKCD